MRQVPALVELHRQDAVARLEQGEVDAHVGDGAGVRLHVGVLGPEQPLGPLDDDRLESVDHLVAAVVAPSRVSLGVLHGEDRALGLHDGERREVLRRDELDARRQALEFGVAQVGNLRVGSAE